MPSIWETASAAIAAAFAEPELLIYTGAGLTAGSVRAVRSDLAAPDFSGVGATLRSVVYEIEAALLPQEPRKGDSFTHRARLWRVQQVEQRPEIAAWQLTVSDGGAA